jgi:hypothetical protein
MSFRVEIHKVLHKISFGGQKHQLDGFAGHFVFAAPTHSTAQTVLVRQIIFGLLGFVSFDRAEAALS